MSDAKLFPAAGRIACLYILLTLADATAQPGDPIGPFLLDTYQSIQHTGEIAGPLPAQRQHYWGLNTYGPRTLVTELRGIPDAITALQVLVRPPGQAWIPGFGVCAPAMPCAVELDLPRGSLVLGVLGAYGAGGAFPGDFTLRTYLRPLYQLHGLNFGPYTHPGEDPDLGPGQITGAELRERIGLVAPFTRWIRTFGCNEDLRAAGRIAHEMGLKIAMGAWIAGDSLEDQKQLDCLEQEALIGNVDMALVGSEVLLRGDLSEAALVARIQALRNTLDAAGIHIPVSSGEVYNVLLRSPALLASVDLVMANYYPFWEGLPIQQAMASLHQAHLQLVDAASGKQVLVSESGWPSCGEAVGAAVPSEENADEFLQRFVSWARINDVQYFFFEALPEPWKEKNEGPLGACWGVMAPDGRARPGLARVLDDEILPGNWSALAP